MAKLISELIKERDELKIEINELEKDIKTIESYEVEVNGK